MNDSINWRNVWEDDSKAGIPDFKLDHAMDRRSAELESLSEQEHMDFIDPREFEVVLDAGCGTGENIVRLHSRVRKIIGIDYASGSIERCRKNLSEKRITNAELLTASLTDIPLPDWSVDRIICFSVLQYLNHEEVRRTLREFVRILNPGGTVILHVKNSSSLYWSALRAAKKLKTLLGGTSRTYNLRPYKWYMRELAALNFHILDYRGFNVFTLDGMPAVMTELLQKYEFRNYKHSFWRLPFVRCHGADLKIKAIL